MERLMFFIEHRLAQLGWSRDDLAAAGGPSPSTLYKAHRGGRDLAERTSARLELALGWQPGSAQRVVDGGAPSLCVFEQVQTVSESIDVAMSHDEDAGVRRTAAELREFLMTVADRLGDFYAGSQRLPHEVADVGAG
jgi:hypothetical protein